MSVATMPCVTNRAVLFTLMAKDWRTFRVPVIALVVLGLGAYGYGLASMYSHFRDVPFIEATTQCSYVIRSTFLATAISALIAAAFGGLAIAGERADRTAILMEMLPVTRRQIVASKWLVTLVTFVVTFALHMTVGLFAYVAFLRSARLEYREPTWNAYAQMDDYWIVPLLFAPFAICFFGVAWLVGNCTRSAAISACISIAISIAIPVFTTQLLFGSFALFRPLYGSRVGELILPASIALLVALFTLILGTLIYLKRVEP